MSKTAKYALVSGVVCAVLAAAAVILLLTAPKGEADEDSSSSQAIQITDMSADNVLSITVENESGTFTFNRVTAVSDDSGDGETVTESYYWVSDELLGVGQSDNSVRSFISGFASLTAARVIEEEAEDLAKFGLETPLAKVFVYFDDGTDIELNFGIDNPLSSTSVYFCVGNTVMLTNKSGVSGAFKEVRDFANLFITKSLGSDENVEYITIKRRDLDEDIEIRYMSELDAARDDENYVVSTLNTYRFTSPYNAEINVSSGAALCEGMCGLTMKSCAYLEASDENLALCGLDDPYCTVIFSYGGEERTLLLGDKAVEIVSESSGDIPQLYEVTGYYAMLVGVPGIFVISTDAAPWYDFTPADYVSSRPVSAYIFGCESVEITVSDKSYSFEINAADETFSCGGQELDGDIFREFYEQLVGAVGEEVYTGDVGGDPTVTVKFSYNDKYAVLYGTTENTLGFYAENERKSIVTLDGVPIFRVSSIYVERLVENIDKLLSGEEVNTVW